MMKFNRVDIIYLLFLLCFFCFCFSMALSSISIVTAFFLSVFYVFKEKRTLNKKKIIIFSLINLPLLLAIFDFFITKDFAIGLRNIEGLAILFLGSFAIFFTENKKSRIQKNFLLYFAHVVVLIYALSYISGFNYYLETGLLFEHKHSNKFLEIQHNYLSIYGIFAIIIYWYNLQKNKQIKNYVLFILGTLFILLLIVLISSRAAIVLFFIFFGIVSLLEIFKRKKIKYLIFVAISIPFAYMLLDYFPKTLERFEKLKIKDRSPRYQIWDCCLQIINEKTTFFYGLGADVQKHINQCLTENRRGVWLDLHSHNQTLDFLLSYGWFITFILTSIHLFFVYLSFKTRNYVFLFLMISISFLGLYENYFHRFYGVIFYAVFVSFFLKETAHKSSIIHNKTFMN